MNGRRRLLSGFVASVATALFCTPALARALGQAPDDDISYVRVVVALLLCLMLAVAGAVVLKARSGAGFPRLNAGRLLQLFAPKQSRRLELVETLRVGPQANLCIVRCDGEDLLLASGPEGTELLERLSRPIKSDPVQGQG